MLSSRPRGLRPRWPKGSPGAVRDPRFSLNFAKIAQQNATLV
jgi:hypothetical protein